MPGETGELAAPHVPSAAMASARLVTTSRPLYPTGPGGDELCYEPEQTTTQAASRSLCPLDLASFAQQGLSLPVSQVPWRRWLAFCLPADLLPRHSRNSLIVAVTVEGCKRDQGEEISFIRTTRCVLNCVV